MKKLLFPLVFFAVFNFCNAAEPENLSPGQTELQLTEPHYANHVVTAQLIPKDIVILLAYFLGLFFLRSLIIINRRKKEHEKNRSK